VKRGQKRVKGKTSLIKDKKNVGKNQGEASEREKTSPRGSEVIGN